MHVPSAVPAADQCGTGNYCASGQTCKHNGSASFCCASSGPPSCSAAGDCCPKCGTSIPALIQAPKLETFDPDTHPRTQTLSLTLASADLKSSTLSAASSLTLWSALSLSPHACKSAYAVALPSKASSAPQLQDGFLQARHLRVHVTRVRLSSL